MRCRGAANGDSGLELVSRRQGRTLVTNSIILHNQVPLVLPDAGPLAQMSYSIVQGGFEGIGAKDSDPKVVQWGHWGLACGPALVVDACDPDASWVGADYHFQADSPCGDAGDPPLILHAPWTRGSRRNNARQWKDGGHERLRGAMTSIGRCIRLVSPGCGAVGGRGQLSWRTSNSAGNGEAGWTSG